MFPAGEYSFHFSKSPWLLGGHGLWLCRAALRAREGGLSLTTALGNAEGAAALGPRGL